MRLATSAGTMPARRDTGLARISAGGPIARSSWSRRPGPRPSTRASRSQSASAGPALTGRARRRRGRAGAGAGEWQRASGIADAGAPAIDAPGSGVGDHVADRDRPRRVHHQTIGDLVEGTKDHQMADRLVGQLDLLVVLLAVDHDATALPDLQHVAGIDAGGEAPV